MNWLLSKIMKKLREECNSSDLPLGPFYIFHLPRNFDNKPYLLPMVGIPTKGCSWMRKGGGCTMCYYGYGFDIPDSDVLKYTKEAIDACRFKPVLHIAPLGSFFDDTEVSPTLRKGILKMVKMANVKRVGTESRAEFITKERVRVATEILGSIKLDVGLGLESSNEFIREFCVNKNLPTHIFLNAIEILKDYNVSVSTHILLKPPFLTEREAINDAVISIRFCIKNGVDDVILLPVNLRTKGTLVNFMVKNSMYRQPWLWSLIKVFEYLPKKYIGNVSISGLWGNPPTLMRIAHNCEKCTPHVIALIERFCYTGDYRHIKKASRIKCECKKEWKKEIKTKQPPLEERLIEDYEKICVSLFGENFWRENKEKILAMIYDRA